MENKLDAGRCQADEEIVRCTHRFTQQIQGQLGGKRVKERDKKPATNKVRRRDPTAVHLLLGKEDKRKSDNLETTPPHSHFQFYPPLLSFINPNPSLFLLCSFSLPSFQTENPPSLFPSTFPFNHVLLYQQIRR